MQLCMPILSSRLFCSINSSAVKPVPLVEGVQLCNQVLPGKFSLHLAGSGEPLLIPYDKLAPIVNPLTELENCTSISLTTNGYFLQDKVDELIS